MKGPDLTIEASLAVLRIPFVPRISKHCMSSQISVPIVIIPVITPSVTQYGTHLQYSGTLPNEYVAAYRGSCRYLAPCLNTSHHTISMEMGTQAISLRFLGYTAELLSIIRDSAAIAVEALLQA